MLYMYKLHVGKRARTLTAEAETFKYHSGPSGNDIEA